MNRAFHDVFGIPDAFNGIEAGGPDRHQHLGRRFERQRMRADAAASPHFASRYLVCLREEVPRPGAGKRVLPGIAPLLDALAAAPQVFLGLLTGNFAEAAEVKLGHFDLWRYFRCGAFGEDAHDRNHLVPVASIARAHRGLPDTSTPTHAWSSATRRATSPARDAHGARVIAVATGGYTSDALARGGRGCRLRRFQ